MVLGNIIRALRHRHIDAFMTQQELADRVGVSRQTINAIERAHHQPSLELAFKIAAVFGEPINRVFFYFPDDEIDENLLSPMTIEIRWDEPEA